MPAEPTANPYRDLCLWDLSDLGVGDVDQALAEIDRRAAAFEARREELRADMAPSTLLSLLSDYEELRALSSRLSNYAGLRFAVSSADQAAQADVAKVNGSLTRIGNRLVFFGLWFKKLPDAAAQGLIESAGKYRYYLESLRRTKPYALEEREEQLINVKDVNGVSALGRVYTILTSQFEFELDGEKLNQANLLTYVRDARAEVREAAYRSLLGKYARYKDAIGEIYRSVVNDWREEQIRLRGYASPIGVRNVANDLPDGAVEALLGVCARRSGAFRRFFAAKRERLGLPEMRRFDLYAPVEQTSAKIEYREGVDHILAAFGGFSERFEDAARRVFDKRHVHSLVQANKRSGAFCAYAGASVVPYVMLSFTGTQRDVATLAHELGHAVHGILAGGESELTYVASLPLAETASVFAEMLLSERLGAIYPERRPELSFQKLEDCYATVLRQAGFVAFEKKAHEILAAGGTIEDISEVYIADLRQQLGEEVEVDDIFRYEWLYIPHIFHSPFYCYSYAFGNLLTYGLFNLYKEKGAPFAEEILKLLSRGGAASPDELARGVGIDLRSEDFWERSFTEIERLVESL